METSISRVFDLLAYNLDHFSKTDFVSDKRKGKWRQKSTAHFIQTVDSISKALVGLGLAKGSRVALLSSNRIEWNVCDFAVMQIGAYLIPLYPTLAEHDMRFILQDAEVDLVFVSDEALYQKLNAVLSGLNLNIGVYTFDEVPNAKNLQELIDIGEQDVHTNLELYRNNISPEDILTIIYTSGTTGTPKGVMLTHNNLVQNVINSVPMLPPGVKKALSFLPLCHVFERMVVYLYLYSDVAVYYAESLDTVVADIKDSKPNIFTAVPRLYEKIYEKIMEKGKELKGIKKEAFFLGSRSCYRV